MRRKGFTLVELLVVIAIIALLMGILMPALARVRQLAFRMTCGSNLAGIGKAMMLYANDYEDSMPRAGAADSGWGKVTFNAGTRDAAYGLTATHTGGYFNVTSCFYLLVKYAEVTPKSFLCKGDTTAKEYTLPTGVTTTITGQPVTDLTQLWDFGDSTTSNNSCSYTYHAPWGNYALTTTSEPGFTVAADKNPWISRGTSAAFINPSDSKVIFKGKDSTDTAGRNWGNSDMHQGDGQQVLFLDTHVNFEKTSYCNVEDDNIYTYARTTFSSVQRGDSLGELPKQIAKPQAIWPLSRKDAVLVNDSGTYGSETAATR
jgi:prepilin-type N-terminal cleavage/methylation domain-containing protein